MAHQGSQVNQETLSCSICLDLLKDPVTIPCGHSYCMDCIKTHWDKEGGKKIHSCPQCRQTFTPRPVLVKNVLLAALVEELKKTGLQAAPADHCYAGPKDVACDVCTGRKLKALKSCLVCLVSYCQKHLQPHFESAAFAKHKLVDPFKKLQENICSRHDEVMKMFCRTDQQCICHLCSVDEHKGHDTISVVAGSAEKQRELDKSRQKIRQKIQDRENDVKVLQQEVKVINSSADKAFSNTEKIFSEITHLIKKKCSDAKKEIKSQQKIEVSRVRERQKKLEQEIVALKKTDAELERLSDIQDHTEFLHKYPSLSRLSESQAIDSSSVDIRPVIYFTNVMTSVSEVRDELNDILRDKWTNVSLSEPQPRTRAEFLKYAREITMDPNAANRFLLLDEGNTKITMSEHPQLYRSHPDRFAYWGQVVSRESLTGRCYWEVELNVRGHIAVTYKNIKRDGNVRETIFGSNNKSWALTCDKYGYIFLHNKVSTSISGPWTSRIGVYLDHSAGILAFYSVSDTMTLLHRVETRFTQPLYAGLCLDFMPSITAELRKLK